MIIKKTWPQKWLRERFYQQELEKLEPEQLQQVFKFSEIWIANFEPKQGSEDAGVRPTIIFQNDTISMYSASRKDEVFTN